MKLIVLQEGEDFWVSRLPWTLLNYVTQNTYPACPETAPRAAKPETDSRARNDKEQEVFDSALPQGNSNVHNIKKKCWEGHSTPS